MEQPSSPGVSSRRVAWSPSRPSSPHHGGSAPQSARVSHPVSRANSRPGSPESGFYDASTDLNGETLTERPPNKRSRSKFGKPLRPRYQRSRSSNANYEDNENAAPSAIARLAIRTQNNLKMWYLRHSNAGASRRRSENDQLREIEKSQLLFAQFFAVTPMVLLSVSGMQAEDGVEKKVPVILQQLSIKVVEEKAKHYRNMVRIRLEYGSGLGLIKWEIVRGYRDLLVLRTKLKTRSRNDLLTKKVKLPKLPRPKSYKLKKGQSSSNRLEQVQEDDNEEEVYDEVDFVPSSDDELEDSDVNNEDGNDTQHSIHEEPAALGSLTVGASPSNPSGSRRGSAVSASLGNQRPHSHFNRIHTNNSIKSQPATTYAQAIQEWLSRIKYIYTFRSDTNDLMQFLELSHLSLKLSSEYSFHGKEGTLIVRSRASELGWRVSHWHPRDFKEMIERHTKKWVLVRDSYIVVVDNIYSTRIREVFFLDSFLKVKHITEEQGDKVAEAIARDDIDGAIEALPDVPGVHKHNRAKSVFLHLSNNEQELKVATTSERDLRRWQASILQMKARSSWAKKHRFGSFAPVRKNVFGQWFVDGRDYMWVLSEALENATDTIFILDWWLSPELYLRRPPEGNQKWRLDRILKRKAQQGVKIFVVIYRNVGPTIPIDSMWTKHSLLDLHENIHVIRSPNQLITKNSLFWAHHEKLCVVDTTVAFNGGIDLCYGRWDTWQHTLTDDAPSAFLPSEPTAEQWKERTQLFPGKDYSNARVKDFYELNRPFDDMYDRANVPRMPWHDIHQMVVGQPARDLARHFVQRWNYVLRQKIPSRPTPMLLPPADFTTEDLERLQLTGTCEYQVLRSSGGWSLGLKEHEQSIQNAYLQLIEESEHLVYIENQFFITSTEVDGVLIENQIGNALVQRIVRAHENGEAWKAFILVPLMPGFEAEVDSDKASSVRIICQCQFNSISRGPNSIFYRLENLGIRPDQYINFFSLRKWGKFSDTPDAPNGGRVCAELLYIHAKCMIVDDRIAIIGSANINERSMRGLRDSELAVCVRDTKVIESKMAGKPWKAAKFAHSLRMRLMREHLGVDIDKFDIIERYMNTLDATAERIRRERSQRHAKAHAHWNTGDNLNIPSSNSSQPTGTDDPNSRRGSMNQCADTQFPEWLYPELHSFNWYGGTSVNRGVRDYKKYSKDSRIHNNGSHFDEIEGDGFDHWSFRQKQEENVKMRIHAGAEPDLAMEKEARAIMDELILDSSITSREEFRRIFYSRFTKLDILRPLKRAADLPLPHTDEDGLRAVNNENIPIDPWEFSDPLNEQFVNDKWMAVAERNTLIFRLVFRCQPDDEVETWKDYKTFAGHLERFYEKQREDIGPNSLRKSGNHQPERVDKLVLGGSIKRTDPDKIRMNRIRATQGHHSPSSSFSQTNGHTKESNGDLEVAREKLYRETLEKLSEQEESQGQPVSEQQYQEARASIGDQLAKFHLNSRPNTGPDGAAAEGYVDAPEDTFPAAEGNEFDPASSDKILDGHNLGRLAEPVPFPTVNPSKAPLRPSASSTSARRRAMTGSAASISGKPARKWGHFEHVLDAQVAEDMLQGITGHLVIFPTEWLNRELDSGNWNFQLDRIAPLEIYD